MRRWTLRTFWIAAWGAWLWAGYGLWRELPSRLGAEIARLPIHEDEYVEGTTFDGRIAATTIQLETEKRLRRWDLIARSCIEEHPFAREAVFEKNRGFLIVSNGHDWLNAPSVFDLQSGRESEIQGVAQLEKYSACEHDEHPWLLSLGTRDDDPKGSLPASPLLLLDLAQPSVIGAFPTKRDSSRGMKIGGYAFVPGAPRFVVHLRAENGDAEELQVWTVPPGERPLKVHRIDGWGVELKRGRRQVSRNQRLSWTHQIGDVDCTKVLDLETGEIVLAVPSLAECAALKSIEAAKGPQFVVETGSFEHRLAEISWDGTVVVNLNGPHAIDVATKRMLWEKRNTESDKSRFFRQTNGREIEFIETSGVFAPLRWTLELFQGKTRLLEDLDKSQWLATYDLRTGSLVQRIDIDDGQSVFDSPNGRIQLDADGTMRLAHPTPRWGLIALLQTILAAPLVALWGLLQWRKWRRARAAA